MGYTLTKYCSLSDYGYNGFTDTKTVLDPEDDAAHVILGGKWRMPTDAEWTELRENCTWTWVENYNGTGINGRLVTSKTNGNSIFLPAAGSLDDTSLHDAEACGYYWSSSLQNAGTSRRDPSCAWDIDFDSDNVNRCDNTRCSGLSVRPVTE